MLKNNHDKIRELAKEEPILLSVLNMVEYGHSWEDSMTEAVICLCEVKKRLEGIVIRQLETSFVPTVFASKADIDKIK